MIIRKNLFLRLFLLIALSTLLHSCRNNELLTEQEAYNNSSQFRPVSKTIRLEQSKHQLVLKTELQKAQDNLQKIKTNASGKTVDYANGVSVDTDHVTYIEYGPVFHTYTFNLIRENAPENAPVENLVLASLPDGGYKELLVTYNFTPQEKLVLVSGKGVKTAGKTTAIELAPGTYSGGISNKGMGGTESCSYNTVDMYFSCYTGEHNEGNESSWGGCNWQSEGGYPAQHLTVVALVCTADTSLGDDGSGGGVSIGDTSGLGSGTNDGTPTLPTLTLPKQTPCGKVKTLISRPIIKDSLISFKAYAQTNKKTERGFQEFKSGSLVKGNVNGDNLLEFGIGSNSLGTVHTHQPKTIGILAPQDIMTFLHIVRQQDPNSLGNAYSGTVSSSGTYFIYFTGTASDLPPEMTEAQEEAYVNNLVTNYIDFNDLTLEEEGKSPKGKLSNQGLEKLFNYLINTMGLSGKIILIKEESGNTSTIEFNPDGSPKIPNPC